MSDVQRTLGGPGRMGQQEAAFLGGPGQEYANELLGARDRPLQGSYEEAASEAASAEQFGEFKGSGSQMEKSERSDSMPSAASLFESLFASRPDLSAAAPTTQIEQPSGVHSSEIQEIVDKMVERILVAEPTKGSQEVRITLGEGRLSGTELSITRHADGQLAIRVSCMDAASFQTAVSARAGLVEHLEALGEKVEVNIDQHDQSGDDQGDTRRRSQGLWATEEEEDRR